MAPNFYGFLFAAGESKRFYPFDKKFYQFDFGSLIDLNLTVLQKYGINPIIFVDEHQDYSTFCSIYQNHKNLQMVPVDTREIGSFGTFLEMIKFSKQNKIKDILLFDSDIIFDPTMLDLLLDDPRYKVCLSSPLDYKTNDEVFIFTNKTNIIKKMSKIYHCDSKYNFPKSHFIGITKFCIKEEDEYHRLEKKFINKINNEKRLLHWEEDGIVMFNVHNLITDKKWFELDFYEHIKKCENVYRQIYQK